MNDRILVTYSLLSYIWEKKQDIIDTHIPLVCSCIINKGATEITPKDIKEWLNDEYGISNISLGAGKSIISRMVKRGYIKQENKRYFVDTKKVIEAANFTKNGIDNDFSYIIDKIIEYASKNFSQQFNTNEVEEGLLFFLQNHDSDLLFQVNSLFNSLSKQKESRNKRNALKLKYIISQYLLDCKDRDKNILAKMVNLAKGHALTSLMNLGNLSSFQGKLNDVCIALDSPIIYGVLKLSESIDLIEELLERLKELGAKFVVFEENYNEVCITLQNTIDTIETNLVKGSGKYWRHTSRLYRYAKRNNISAYQLQMHLQQLGNTLEKWNIKIIPAPSYEKGYEEIDTNKLEEIISNYYTKDDTSEVEEYLKQIIKTDVNTISYIYRIRGKNPAINLKKCKAILLTTNNIIAIASNHKSLSKISHIIPPCVTDVFLSTILWVNFPPKNNNLNERLLMSECYRNIFIEDNLLKTFYDNIKKQFKTLSITLENVLSVSTSEAIKLLEQKTFNNEEFYTDTTTEEILQEIENKRNYEIKEKDEKLRTYDKNLYSLANRISKIIYWIVWLFFLLLFILGSPLIDLKNWSNLSHKLVNVIVIIISGLSGLSGLLTHCGFIPTKLNIIRCLRANIYMKLKKYMESKPLGKII